MAPEMMIARGRRVQYEMGANPLNGVLATQPRVLDPTTMHGNKTTDDTNRGQLLRSIAQTVANGDVYVPTNDELYTLGMKTPHGNSDARIIVRGSHDADPISWTVYEIEAPEDVQKPHVYLRYRAWSALDGPGRAITGIGDLEIDGVGVNKSVLRDNLEDLRKTPRADENTSDEADSPDKFRRKLDEVVADVNEEYRWSAEEIAGHHGGPTGMPGICDDHRIWLSVEDPWAGWSHTIRRIANLIPRDDAHLEIDIQHAIREAAEAAMVSPSHVEAWGHHEYQLEYRLDPSILL